MGMKKNNLPLQAAVEANSGYLKGVCGKNNKEGIRRIEIHRSSSLPNIFM